MYINCKNKVLSKIMDVTRYEKQNNLRIGSLKFTLEFSGNLKS